MCVLYSCSSYEVVYTRVQILNSKFSSQIQLYSLCRSLADQSQHTYSTYELLANAKFEATPA
jgi:hypothetical protein